MKRNVSAQVVISAKERNEENDNQNSKFVRSEIMSCYYEYPLKIIQPSCASDSVCLWLYPITYGGGLVEGDHISITVTVEKNCCVLWTSLSFLKVYICKNGLHCQQHWNYDVDSESLLCIIPEPVICYKKASFIQTQNVHMTSASNLVLLDWFTSGRYLRGERWQFSKLCSTYSIYINNVLAYKEALNLQSTPLLTVSDAMTSCNITGTCILVGPDIMPISLKVLSQLGKCSSYGEKLTADALFAVSPLTGLDSEICGCTVRFFSASVSEAYKMIEEILSPLFSIIGGNPLKSK